MREKLIELFEQEHNRCDDTLCSECKYDRDEDCGIHALVDHLIANGVTVQNWIPVTERLPKREDANLYESVLAINKEDGVPRSWIWDIVVDYPKEFTHWMPLPPAPKEN